MHDQQSLLPPATLASLSTAWQRCARQNTRLMVVASGCEDWCNAAGMLLLAESQAWQQATGCQETQAQQLCLWLADDLPADAASSRVLLQHVHRRDAQQLLGGECTLAVINCHHGFNANTVAAVSGLVRGGGLWIWLVPALDRWPGKTDPAFVRAQPATGTSFAAAHADSPFLQRLVKMLREHAQPKNNLVLIEQAFEAALARQPPVVRQQLKPVAQPASPIPAGAAAIRPTAAQQDVCDAASTMLQHDAGTVLVTAARGRGKSTALAMVIANTLRDTDWDVVLVAPHRNNVTTLLRYLHSLTPVLAHGTIERVSFRPADALLESVQAENRNAQPVLLVIDEAAGLALSLLERLSTKYPHKIIASTAQGYEGSGRGLLLRFAERLAVSAAARVTADAAVFDKHIQLGAPIRWAEGDPVEYFIGALLCLADRPEGPGHAAATPLLGAAGFNDSSNSEVRVRQEKLHTSYKLATELSYRKLAPADFLADESLLQRVFDLLVEAHYQTQPNDLRLLLDALYAHVWVAVEHSTPTRVVAVLLAIEEGGFEDTELVSAIVAGKRRPRGNLLAQRMANLSGEPSWCSGQSIRVMRIVVVKHWRRCQVATQLLVEMKQWAAAQGLNYWSSSFGYRRELLGFWQSVNALPVHLGMHLDKSSGARNLMVAAALRADTMQTHIAAAAKELYAAVNYWYPRFLPEFEAADKQTLVKWLAACEPQLLRMLPTENAWACRRLRRFVAREIDITAVLPALAALQQADPGFAKLHASATAPNLQQQLQNIIDLAPDWSTLAQGLQTSGQAAVVTELRALCATLCAT